MIWSVFVSWPFLFLYMSFSFSIRVLSFSQVLQALEELKAGEKPQTAAGKGLASPAGGMRMGQGWAAGVEH